MPRTNVAQLIIKVGHAPGDTMWLLAVLPNDCASNVSSTALGRAERSQVHQSTSLFEERSPFSAGTVQPLVWRTAPAFASLQHASSLAPMRACLPEGLLEYG